MPKLRHYDDLGSARFVTFSCYQKQKYLTHTNSIKILLENIKALRINNSIKILGYVIMPDHIHLVLYPPMGVKLGVLIGQLKGRTARSIINIRDDIVCRSNGQPAIWERRFYDHNCRTIDIVIEKINYCHMNPVKSGLVENPGDWIWSSYRWYQGYVNTILDIDGIEI